MEGVKSFETIFGTFEKFAGLEKTAHGNSFLTTQEPRKRKHTHTETAKHTKRKHTRKHTRNTTQTTRAFFSMCDIVDPKNGGADMVTRGREFPPKILEDGFGGEMKHSYMHGVFLKWQV